MNALYLDVFSGISGDMFIGALLDLGVGVQHLAAEVAKLALKDCHLHAFREKRGQIAGTRFEVHLGHQVPHIASHDHQHDQAGSQPHRTYADIKKIISASQLAPWVKDKALAVFQRLAQAEGKIHGLPPAQVHFHEVGAVDSIIDVVGACVALEILGQPRVFSGPVVDGHGTVQCAHGAFPLPAPATLEILGARGIRIEQCDEPQELVTPTGAALLAEFAESFGPMPPFTPSKIGYGLGTRENKTRPNVLRAILGDTAAKSPHDWESDTVTVLETNLDDLNPEILGAFMEKALAAGALDIFYTPVQMKKNRPGVMLSLLCASAEADRFSEMLLRETSAFGVRRFSAERRKLQREFIKVTTEFGEVSVKISRLHGAVVQVAPEFESCKALAERANVPIKTIYEAALKKTNP